MPFSLLVLFAAILGACLGSFCNVLLVRLKEERSVWGRSACLKCQRTLTALELIPVCSWVVLRGKCRSCKVPIHLQYPLVELAGAAIGMYAITRSYHAGMVQWDGVIFTALFLFILLVIAVFDLRWQLVPTAFTLWGGALLVIWNLVSGQPITSLLLGMAVTGGVLAALVWGSGKRWMGEGDPLVGAVIGAALGWPMGPLALLVGFMVGGVVAVALLATRVVSRKTPVPFVPFLAFGALLVYAWSEQTLFLFRYAFGI